MSFRRNAPAALLSLLALLVPITACAPQVDAPQVDAAQAESPSEGVSLEYPRWETNDPGDQAAYNRRVNLIQRGGEVYSRYCVGCHGEAGDGHGPATARLITKPRDFTSGIYKFRSTDSGSLPLESDLYRTLTRGLSGVSMPAFPLMSHRDKLSVIEYIKTFYPGWEAEKIHRTIVPVPRAPGDLGSARRIQRGRVVYLAMQCTQCHGVDGQGKGATRTEYVDAWGDPQKPFNFTRGSLKGGNAPEDIYRTFHTGLRSVMPAYGGLTLASIVAEGFPPGELPLEPGELDALMPMLDDFPATAGEMAGMGAEEQTRLAERNSWDLVAYILSLRQVTTTAEAVLGPAALQEASTHE